MKDNETRWINARQVYGLYGIPRNLLRELADSGKIGRREVSFSSGKRMFLYDERDCKKFIG